MKSKENSILKPGINIMPLMWDLEPRFWEEKRRTMGIF